MRVLVIAADLRPATGYPGVMRDGTCRALERAGIDHALASIDADLTRYAGFDIAIGAGDELFWRNLHLIPVLRKLGITSADMRARYMNPRLTLWPRQLTDHRKRGPDFVMTHFPSQHPRGLHIGHLADERLLYPEQEDRLTLFIDHDFPSRRNRTGAILAEAQELVRKNPDLRVWYQSDRGIVENDFARGNSRYRTYPFEEIAAYYRRTHILLPTHRETQGTLAIEIGLCGGLTLLERWMYPEQRRKEVPHQLYKGRITLPDQVDIDANRALTRANFGIARFTERLQDALVHIMTWRARQAG